MISNVAENRFSFHDSHESVQFIRRADEIPDIFIRLFLRKKIQKISPYGRYLLALFHFFAEVRMLITSWEGPEKAKALLRGCLPTLALSRAVQTHSLCHLRQSALSQSGSSTRQFSHSSPKSSDMEPLVAEEVTSSLATAQHTHQSTCSVYSQS